MRNLRRQDIWLFIKIAVLIFIFIKDIVLYYNGLYKPVEYYVLIYSFLIAILTVNDLFRIFCIQKYENAGGISLVISFLSCNIIFYYLSSTGIYLYYLLLFFDIIVLTLGMKAIKRRICLILHFVLYCIAVGSLCLNFELDLHQNLNNMFRALQSTSLFDLRFLLPPTSYQPWIEKVKLYFWYSMPLLMLYLLSFLMFYQAALKVKFQALSEVLSDANNKLEKHSKIVEELAKANERNRIAQDMHDSVGHLLTALIMNLDVIERTIGKESENMPGLISKCQRFARGALESMRETVKTLREAGVSGNFNSSVAEMINDIQDKEGLKIDFKSSEKAEGLTPDKKNILYRAIQESITNSLKHGNPTLISINIEYVGERLLLTITDNGAGTGFIIKGCGLKGIENRMLSINGEISFSSTEGGFKTTASIPLK